MITARFTEFVNGREIIIREVFGKINNNSMSGKFDKLDLSNISINTETNNKKNFGGVC